MSTEERDESLSSPKKVMPTSVRKENVDQEGERRPYNQGYNRPEGSYEHRPYRSYGDNNRSSYGDRPGRQRYDNREGGSGNREGGYGNNRSSYGNNREGGYSRPSYGSREGGYNGRPSYGNNRPSYGNGGGDYNRPSRPNYDAPAKQYSAAPSNAVPADGMKKRRPRVGDSRVNYNEPRDRKSTRLNSSHSAKSRMPSSA